MFTNRTGAGLANALGGPNPLGPLAISPIGQTVGVGQLAQQTPTPPELVGTPSNINRTFGPGRYANWCWSGCAWPDEFSKPALPAGTVDTLLKPENKAMLTGILTYHVVAGKMDAAALLKAIADGNGKASIKTVAGGTLTAMKSGMGITVTDEKGGSAHVTIADVYQSNGVIHVVDKVLLPK